MKYFIGSFLLVAALILTSTFVASKDDTIVLTKDNSVTFTGEVNGSTVAVAIDKLNSLDQINTKDPIYLVLDTPGGSIQDGFTLIVAAKGLKRKVKPIVVFAASMGFQIAESLDERLITEFGVLMSHKASGSFGGEFPGQVNSRLNFWLDRIAFMDNNVVARTNGKQTLKSYQDAYENELWLTAQKSVEGGYADKIVNVRCGSDLLGTREESVSTILGDFQLTMSNCPLITDPLKVKMPSTGNFNIDYAHFILKQKLNERRTVKKGY